MDAVKFLEERNRMCDNYNLCTDGCPLHKICDFSLGYFREIVAIVEKWSEEHPLKTNGMVIMETLARMDVPCVGTSTNGLKQKMEIEIDAEWWDAEYKEGEQC